jgi:phage-related minor tail protein
MKISVVVASAILLASGSEAFAPAVVRQQRPFVSSPRYMSDEEPKPSGGALVPIKEETVEFTAGLIGGVAGLVVGGPFLGAVLAAIANYASKSEGDVGVVVQSISKASLEVFNYLANLNNKYEVLNKAQSSLETSLEKLKSQDTIDKETVDKVEKALSGTTAKIKEINDEYDVVGGSLTALGVLGELVEKAVDKAKEVNSEYKITDKALTSAKQAVEKAKEAAKEVKMN